MKTNIHFSYNIPGSKYAPADGTNCIIGSTFCEKYRIDYHYANWLETLNQIRDKYENIYVQQPFYLFNAEQEIFLDCIKALHEKKLIDGVLVNNYAMLKNIYERFNISLVLSRFAIGKRNQVNKYFIELILKQNAAAFEVYSYSPEVINELMEYKDKIDIWIRESNHKINAFARECFIKSGNTGEACSRNHCITDEFSFIEKDNKYKLKISGHILLEPHNVPAIPGDFGQTAVISHGGIEI